MNIISWNIQAAKGVDGDTRVDRIASVLEAMGDADIICCQEVMQDTASEGADQVRQLAERFPDHEAFFGSAIDRPSAGGRLRFGNLVLSRLPVLQCLLHKLPQPADSATRNMPRQAIEVIVQRGGRPCRIVTTHLEYFSATQRSAQVAYLAALYRETRARAADPALSGGPGLYASAPETEATILCGDLNLTLDSADYRFLAGNDRDDSLLDAWPLLHPGTDRPPTCGVFDRVQWQEGPHCRDYFFVAPELAAQVSAVTVNTETDASDHQPIMLTLSGFGVFTLSDAEG